MYIIGAAVGGRVSFNSNDEHDAMDGELVCRVLQLMNLTDARLSQVQNYLQQPSEPLTFQTLFCQRGTVVLWVYATV